MKTPKQPAEPTPESLAHLDTFLGQTGWVPSNEDPPKGYVRVYRKADDSRVKASLRMSPDGTFSLDPLG
jgi:hypothetical protein